MELLGVSLLIGFVLWITGFILMFFSEDNLLHVVPQFLGSLVVLISGILFFWETTQIRGLGYIFMPMGILLLIITGIIYIKTSMRY